MSSDRRQQIRATIEERGEFMKMEDGMYYWPKGNEEMSANDLRIIADILDEENEDWDDQARQDLTPPHPPAKRSKEK